MILVLGGTTEGKILACVLRERGYPVWMSVAYGFAREFVPEFVPVRSGPFSLESLQDFLREKGVRAIVDATHPFAQNIKELAWKASQELGIPYLAYERPTVSFPPSVIPVESVDEVLKRLSPYRRIFFTIGTKLLASFVQLKAEGKTIRVRVLPVSSSLRRCEELGLTPREVVAVLGPVSAKLNRVLFQEFEAEVVVSKDSGREGGLLEKIEATSSLKIPLLLLARSLKWGRGVFYDIDALCERLGELYGT